MSDEQSTSGTEKLPDCPNCGVRGEPCPNYPHLALLRCNNTNCAVHEFHNERSVNSDSDHGENNE